MRSLVATIDAYAENSHPGFLVIPQNGIELITESGEPEGDLVMDYLSAIDGHGQESLFYGYNRDNKSTPSRANEFTIQFLRRSQQTGHRIIVTDYVTTESKVLDSYSQNSQEGFLSFAADDRNLSTIPDYPDPIHQENAADILNLEQAKNFLYLLNYESFSNKEALLQAVGETNYDVLILDLFFNNGEQFTGEDLERLRIKSNGGSRIILCYMSIGEAEDYRYYWNPMWFDNPPAWLTEENPNWPGNYKVKYWDANWQAILIGSEFSYLDKILETGYDGVYMDIIDAFEYFESF